MTRRMETSSVHPSGGRLVILYFLACWLLFPV